MASKKKHLECNTTPADAAFQKAWSGDPFDNEEWVSQHGDGKTYA